MCYVGDSGYLVDWSVRLFMEQTTSTAFNKSWYACIFSAQYKLRQCPGGSIATVQSYAPLDIFMYGGGI